MSTFARYHAILKRKIFETPRTFDGYLSDGDILSACREEGMVWRERFWTPLQTFWAFLGQVLSLNCSCREAVAKMVALFCWATGALVELAIGPLRRSEIILWRTLGDSLKALDVVLADAYYGSYGDMARLRSRTILIVTSLLDPQAFPLETIADLYRDRWLVELRLRDIKITLGMDILRGKSPDIVRKEIYMYMLAYNLIRVLMWQAAQTHGTPLRRLSFAGTVQRLNALTPYLRLLGWTERTAALYRSLLFWITHDPIPDRPNRIEPRVIKRRKKEYGFLNKPRDEMRRELLR